MTTAVFANSDEAPTISVNDLVGEGKKYATVDDLAKAYANIDVFAENLKAENAQYRQEVATKKSVEELLKEIRQPPTETPSTTNTQVSSGAVSEQDIASLVRQVTAEDRKAETVQINVRQVTERMVQEFGDETKANQAVRAKANELGVSVEFLQSVAAQSPKAFFSQMGIGTGSPIVTPGPTRSSVVTPPSNNNSLKEGTYAWFRQQQIDDPKLRYDRAFQLKIHSAAIEASRKGINFY